MITVRDSSLGFGLTFERELFEKLSVPGGPVSVRRDQNVSGSQWVARSALPLPRGVPEEAQHDALPNQ